MLGSRLRGLLLMAVGLTTIHLVNLAWATGWFNRLVPSAPPGLRPEALPSLSPLTCLAPLLVLGALGLVIVGLRELFFPRSD